MNLAEYRASDRERARVGDLMALLPSGLSNVLDVGARDGFISRMLADRGARVTALDLECPRIEHEGVHCVQGDATALGLPDEAFDLVFCAEVIEHIPDLAGACRELSRVSNRYLLIGVPYRQDLRVGRCTCRACGKRSPPWGHINRFDEPRLAELFPDCRVLKKSFVGIADKGTNALSCALMDLAGNPYGTYEQDEPCVHCGAAFTPPPPRHLGQRLLTRAAVILRRATTAFETTHPNWIHLLLEKAAR